MVAPREVVGWYGVAWNIAGTLVAPSAILAATLYPRFSKSAGDANGLKGALDASLRPLILVAVLGAVGTYLFADGVVGLIYGASKFGQAADILKAFAFALPLIYLDMLFGAAIFGMGKAGRLASCKFAAVVVTSAAALLLVPLFQTRYGNGGIGVVVATAAGELVMVGASILLTREIVHRRMILHLARTLLAGGLTVLLIKGIPAIPFFVAIPLCVAAFFVVATCRPGAGSLPKRAEEGEGIAAAEQLNRA
jgi:O-antigen/teichoic acid export membrane protein